MKHSLTKRVFIYILVFIIALFVMSASLIYFILPKYYQDKKIEEIDKQVTYIESHYDQLSQEELVDLFDQLQKEQGGDSYVLNANNEVHDWVGMRGNGMGKNRPARQELTFDSPLVQERVTNTAGLEVYRFAVEIDQGYLLYEVAIASLNEAVDLILEFMFYLFTVSILIGIIAAGFISRFISSPIRRLNTLAKTMRKKEVIEISKSHRQDEIGQLEVSLFLLYDELLSNIQRLESELKKERSIEKMKKQFLAQATHELKTPVSVIQGYSEIVYDGMYESAEERDQYIEKIYYETENMSQLIMDVLDYSKMENGYYTIYKESTPVKPWLKKIQKQYAAYVEIKNKDFVFQDFTEARHVDMDANRMEQVIKNLLSNAIYYAKSQVTLRVSNPNGGLHIEVENNGPAIEEEALPFIFDSFYKEKGKAAGTGLGLAIVKQIILLHQGEYRVENTSDGVKFIVSV